MIIGLTGPTGSGKSTASLTAAELGFTVIDCDRLARTAVEKGSRGLAALVEVFGEEILRTDGTLDRKKLAETAFSSRSNTELLNKTLLPYVVQLVKERAEGCGAVLLDAPTLFESGVDSMCDTTVAVLADKKIRLGRIMRRDGIDERSALLRIGAGKPDEYYKERADFILFNNDDPNEFICEFKKIIVTLSGNGITSNS